MIEETRGCSWMAAASSLIGVQPLGVLSLTHVGFFSVHCPSSDSSGILSGLFLLYVCGYGGEWLQVSCWSVFHPLKSSGSSANERMSLSILIGGRILELLESLPNGIKAWSVLKPWLFSSCGITGWHILLPRGHLLCALFLPGIDLPQWPIFGPGGCFCTVLCSGGGNLDCSLELQLVAAASTYTALIVVGFVFLALLLISLFLRRCRWVGLLFGSLLGFVE